jgi:hypothetical protein
MSATVNQVGKGLPNQTPVETALPLRHTVVKKRIVEAGSSALQGGVVHYDRRPVTPHLSTHRCRPPYGRPAVTTEFYHLSDLR